MAGDWIKVEHALPDKPEVMEMATTLGIDSDAVVGKLIRIWTWFDNHTSDGNAPVTVRALLNRYTGVTGFVTAMENVGWISESNGSLTVSRFERHNGQTAKERANTNRRVSKSRKCNASTVTNVTLQPLQKPLPEKRREEKSIERASAKAPSLALEICDNQTKTQSDYIDQIATKINRLAPPWAKRPHLSFQEKQELMTNLAVFTDLQDHDWCLLGDYLGAIITEDQRAHLNKPFQPDNRSMFIRSVTDVLQHADRWATLTKWRASA